MTAIDSLQGLRVDPRGWYISSRTAYRNFNYGAAIETGRRALEYLNVPADRLPETTDPAKIEEVLTAILYPNATGAATLATSSFHSAVLLG
jgi:hypothetical protein